MGCSRKRSDSVAWIALGVRVSGVESGIWITGFASCIGGGCVIHFCIKFQRVGCLFYFCFGSGLSSGWVDCKVGKWDVLEAVLEYQ